MTERVVRQNNFSPATQSVRSLLRARQSEYSAGAETVRHGHEIRPVGSLLDGHPPLQRCQIHNLIPELFVLHDRQIQLRQYAAKVKAVARSAVRCNAECHIFRISEHAAFTCRILRKFCTGVAAGRSDHKNGADSSMNPVGFRDRNGSLQIDINIIFILHAGVVDNNIKRRKRRILLFIADIETEVV